MTLASPSGSPVAPGCNPEPDQPRRTLLIVDDEEGPRRSLKIVFEDDYDLHLADCGTQALELLARHHIDAAVLDIRMAGMSGTELLARIKEIDPLVEVVMLTAYETIDTMRHSLRYGACDFLTKPFDVSTMRAAVFKAMQRRALGDEVRSSTRELQQLREEIQRERMQSEMARQKGEIYASVIHDINNPLTIISSIIEIITEQISEVSTLRQEDMATIQEQLSQISQQVANCGRISRRYLGFLRQRNAPESGVSVNQVLADLKALLKSHPSWLQNQLRVQPLPVDVPARINGTDLIQILLNLVINAFQACSHPHTVEVSATFLDDAVSLASIEPGPNDLVLDLESEPDHRPYVRLTVSDDGPGIPGEILPRVFEPYFTTREKGDGTGLGLAIVHRLTRASNGLLHLHAERGKGTTFNIFIPARATVAKPA